MEIKCNKNWGKINDIINSNLNIKSKNILIQSGHFSVLFNRYGELIPAIIEEVDDEELKEFITCSNYMNDFPTRTFEKGVEVASDLRKKSVNVKFSFIVNDWQWVNKGLYNFPTNRINYYKKQTLPEYYVRLLQRFQFGLSDIIRADQYVKKSIFYSEHKLRKKGKKTISDCSPESCTIEYLPFLLDSLKDFDTLISFIPMSCKIPVLYSTIRFIKEQSSNINLFHIFYNPSNKELEMSFLNNSNISLEYEKEIKDSYIKMGLMSK